MLVSLQVGSTARPLSNRLELRCQCLRECGTVAGSFCAAAWTQQAVAATWCGDAHLEDGLRLDGMLRAGTRPNTLTLNSAISACEKSSLWQKSLQLLFGTLGKETFSAGRTRVCVCRAHLVPIILISSASLIIDHYGCCHATLCPTLL